MKLNELGTTLNVEGMLAFEELLTAAEVGKMLHLHPVTVQRWARESRLPHFRYGRKIRFRASELDTWCTASNVKPIARVN